EAEALAEERRRVAAARGRRPAGRPVAAAGGPLAAGPPAAPAAGATPPGRAGAGRGEAAVGDRPDLCRRRRQDDGVLEPALVLGQLLLVLGADDDDVADDFALGAGRPAGRGDGQA